jgi:hypothetical protein
VTISHDLNSLPAAAPIVSNVPRSFARGVLTRRHPDLIATVRRLVPCPPAIQESLDQLLVTIGGTIPPLPAGSHDLSTWQECAAPYLSRPWVDVPFLWAESYFYRLLLEATGYFGSGPWAGIDSFAPQKNAKLNTPDLARDLRDLDLLLAAPDQASLSAALAASLWGNRADLGFRMSDPGAQGKDQVDDLVADDSAELWRLLDAGAPGRVHLIADNAGRELVADVVLVDRLLATERAAIVALHLKPHPYYVSDATTADLLQVLRRLEEAGDTASGIAARLTAAINDG